MLDIKIRLLIILTLLCLVMYSQTPTTSGIDWDVINITSNNELNAPNTLLYGPDGYLWITERVGKKVVKIDPNGSIPISKTTMLDLTGVVYQSVTQDGLMGMAIHPDLYADPNTSTNNYVYLVYTYDANPGAGINSNIRIARYTYNSGTGNLDSGSESVIIDGIEAGEDHNSGKITIGPDLKLYFTIGEHGANRGTRACNEIRAQYLPTSNSDYSDYKGKILRLNLDGTIPVDNPILNGVKSHVYTYGHRNAQGIIFGSNGKLYASEHGDRTDDELNIITSGKNYGWPLIAGYADDLAYAYFNWSAYPADCGSYDFNNPPGPTIAESTSVSTIPDFEPPIGTYNSTITTTGSDAYLTWPTPAPSSIDIYEAGKIPNWGTSLLIPTLKHGTIYRAKLNTTGDALEDGTFEVFHSSNDRYRDVALDPDGITIYAITDISGQTTGSPTGTTSVPLTNKGVVMKIQYTGTTLGVNKDVHSKFSVIPNPATSNAKLNFNTVKESFVNLQIFDPHGRMVQQINNILNNHILNISDFANGLYFLKINNENNKESETKKLIIAH
jgi:PQQ-dependent dehydrogenase (s-GDH family)